MSFAPRNNYYNKNLKERAHNLRYEMTKAEACLWKYGLRAKMMNGYTFNRQRPVLNYIADFMCKELKLIIEIDGISHGFEKVIEKDIIRQKKLEDAGFTVIRFKDSEVLNQMEAVKRVIFDTITALEVDK